MKQAHNKDLRTCSLGSIILSPTDKLVMIIGEDLDDTCCYRFIGEFCRGCKLKKMIGWNNSNSLWWICPRYQGWDIIS